MVGGSVDFENVSPVASSKDGLGKVLFRSPFPIFVLAGPC